MKKGDRLRGWMLVEGKGFPSVNPQFGGLFPIYHTRKEAVFARDYHNNYLLLKNKKVKPRKFIIKCVDIEIN